MPKLRRRSAELWLELREERSRRRMRLNQVTVSSTDIPRSVEFYKKLGLVQLCLYYAGDNRVNPPWRIGGPR
jgi:hypothetical protein